MDGSFGGFRATLAHPAYGVSATRRKGVGASRPAAFAARWAAGSSLRVPRVVSSIPNNSIPWFHEGIRRLVRQARDGFRQLCRPACCAQHPHPLPAMEAIEELAGRLFDWPVTLIRPVGPAACPAFACAAVKRACGGSVWVSI